MPQLILLEAARKIFKLHGYTGEMLKEAIPYISEFKNKLIVLKIGGSIIEDKDTEKEFIEDVAFMMEIGIKLIIIHGGGKHLTEALLQKGITSDFHNGLRITTKDIVETAEEVFTKINHGLTNELEEAKVKAFPYNHAQNLIEAEILDDSLGFVGKPIALRNKLLQEKVEEGIVPIIPALGLQGKQLLNINADTVAGFIAREMKAEKLILMTNVDGLCDDKGSLISTVDQEKVEELINSGTIRGGMVPKVKTCLDALEGGVHKAHIINGSGKTFVNEVLTDKGVGTQIIHK
ncbi:MAG: acetylglutamate kinase [Nitrospinae bacterium]|nr:acetylglutamate kinase [Nitrospinota bacterium]